MEERLLTCIVCPMGCQVTVTMDNGTITNVTGNSCPRGDIYVRKETTSPTRVVTTTVPVTGGDMPFVSVKTKTDIPKSMIFDCLKALKNVKASAPVSIGDVIVSNVAGTGSDIVATQNVHKN